LDFQTKHLDKASPDMLHIKFSNSLPPWEAVGVIAFNGNTLVFKVSLTEEHYNLVKVEFLPKLSFVE
jgi:hypothetical protein